MYGLALDCRECHVLGPDIDIYIHEADETNTRIRPKRIAAAIAATGGLGLVTLVGVQSSSPEPWTSRAASAPPDPGGDWRLPRLRLQIAMLPQIPADLREALDLGGLVRTRKVSTPCPPPWRRSLAFRSHAVGNRPLGRRVRI
jgi:hypothetical protein